MADGDRSGESEAARLEAALARIARAQAAAPREPPPPDSARVQSEPAPTAEIKSRLDTLISEIRAVLGRDSSD